MKRFPFGTKVLVRRIMAVCDFNPPVIGKIISRSQQSSSYRVIIPSKLANNSDRAWWIGQEDIVSAFYPMNKEDSKK